MKWISMLVLALSLSACGGSTSVNQTVVSPACQEATDCSCPVGYTASCEDATCLCLRTEEVEVPVEIGCETAADCDCGSTGPMGPYQATCLDQLCYCAELNNECYPLTRGEFIFELMNKLVYLGDYVPPTTPTYSDVPADHFYYGAIEAATELGIVQGDVDANGNPLGIFRPEDNLNRAEGAKVVIQAINGLSGMPQPFTPHYLDVHEADWFFVYVEAATVLNLTHGYVNQDGTSTGYYGPADVASSCFMNGMMAHADFPDVPMPGDFTIVLDEIGFNDLIAIEGTIYGFSARYRVYDTSASNPLNDLTVVNQPYGEGSAVESTMALEQVYISCAPPSGDGSWTFYPAPLVDGYATFAGLGCYDETGDGLQVQVVYDVAHMATVGDILSGQVFRLVLEDGWMADSQAEIPSRVVRKTKPSFMNSPLSSSLQNGENSLHRFQVSMHTNGPGSLARMVYEISPQDADIGGELHLSYFKLFRGTDLMATSIRDGNGLDLTGNTSPSTSEIVVSFISEEVLAPGTTQTFTLKATASGVEFDDAITTILDPADEAMPVVGMTAETTPNTARLVSSIPTMGLFLTQNHFFYDTPPDRNLIWSDHSSSGHLYSVGDSASSYDWTNGYRLGLSQLAAVTITAN